MRKGNPWAWVETGSGFSAVSASRITHQDFPNLRVFFPSLQQLYRFSLFLAAPEGVARGSDALTLLEYPETRNQFIDELMEVPSSSGCLGVGGAWHQQRQHCSRHLA